MGEDSTQLIISLDRDFMLIRGQGCEGCFQGGLTRLDKVGKATYSLECVAFVSFCLQQRRQRESRHSQ